MLVLGIEPSYDEIGVTLYNTHSGLRAHALYSQIAMHREYGGVIPELTSRDHTRRVISLLEEVLGKVGAIRADINAIAYMKDPGLAGVLLVNTSVANALAFALDKPLVAVRHLEGHLLSPLLETNRPEFLFLVLLVSDRHTQLMHIDAVGQYALFGETSDDAAGEAFNRTAKLLGLDYPGGPAVPRLAKFGDPSVFDLPRPMLYSGDFSFLFAGLKTAVLTQMRKLSLTNSGTCYQPCADLARAFVDVTVEVLVKETPRVTCEHGLKHIVMADGVGVNRQLREGLNAEGKKRGLRIHYPDLQFCTDNGAMIAFAGAMWLQANPARVQDGCGYGVTPRWDLGDIRIWHA